uniref:Putative secreted protein n=1 Tax=Anopheles darlingi TaxID=43151 RepID=A0A2M4DHQ5_ANODA
MATVVVVVAACMALVSAAARTDTDRVVRWCLITEMEVLPPTTSLTDSINRASAVAVTEEAMPPRTASEEAVAGRV